ncbi:MAG: hypothetical protein ACE5I3_06455 [Phycisphaerae bacterium]
MLLILAATAAPLGCENQPARPLAVPAGVAPEVVLKTPEDAARSALTCLQADLRAIRNRDEQAAKACLEKLRRVAAVTTIEQTLARMPQFKTIVGDDAIKGFINNWGATIAYYAAGLQLEQMRRVSESASRVGVVVPASGPEDDALIQVTCVRGADDLWRVSRIEFVVETPTARPARPPATQPASQP